MVEAKGSARFTAEFLGTFLLTVAVGCNTLSGAYIWGATSNACTLMVLIFAFGDVSGAHFNPAVSVASFICDGISFGEMLVYICCQLIGAAAGSLTYSLLFYHSFNIGPMIGFNWMQAAVAETIYTMMLCFVVLSTVKAVRPNQGDQFAPLAIGFVLIAGAYGGGAISGGCFNPAIALAIDVSSAGLGFGWSFAYIGYQFIGAALGGVFFRLTRPSEFGQAESSIKVGAGQSDVKVSQLIGEWLGTFILTITVGLNVLAGSRAGAWSIGASLMCMVYALGDVSGANFNPAVTLAVVATSDTPSHVKGALYMAVQFIAGLMGAWTFAWMYDWQTFSLGPVGHYGWAARIPVEAFFTFVLCLTVLSVACVKVSKVLDEYFGLAIGACISVGGYAVGMIAGGTMNPAVTFGIATTSLLASCGRCPGALWSLLYILIEFTGALLAAAVFLMVRPGEYMSGLKSAQMNSRDEGPPSQAPAMYRPPAGMAPTTLPPQHASMMQHGAQHGSMAGRPFSQHMMPGTGHTGYTGASTNQSLPPSVP